MKNSFQLVTTDDGSHTVFIPELNEHYHSRFGAINESLHIFIKAGLESLKPLPEITVFEVGFGTGLNALLTLDFSIRNNRKIIFHTIDNFELSGNIVNSLNYPGFFSDHIKMKDYLCRLHDAGWNTYTRVTPGFLLHKIKADFTGYYPDFPYDIIYFDAFAPDKQPEMWHPALFERLAEHLNTDGVLVTYCAKGVVKRALRNAGLTVELLPGPAGKRHIVRAIKRA